MKKRKSYFGELRDKELAERERQRNNGRPMYYSSAALPISRVRLPPRPNYLNEILDEVDIWSFENRRGGSTVDLVQDNPPSSKSKEGQGNDKQQGPLAQPAEDECEDEDDAWDSNAINVIAGPSSSRAISIVSNRFRKLNENSSSSSNLKHVLSKSLFSKGKSPGFEFEDVGETCAVTWKTPEKNLEVIEPLPSSPSQVPGFTQEVNQLESSIIVEESPVDLNKRRRSRRPLASPKRISFSPPEPTTKGTVISPPASQSIHPTSSPKVNRKRVGVQVNYRSQSSSEHLSNLISEVASSSQSTFSPSCKTPMSVWIFQDQTEAFHVDSPESQDGKPEGEGLQLVENFKAIKSRYDMSVRLFAHDLRNGKYEEERHLDLFIRKITEKQEKMMVVLAYDLVEERDRWVMLRIGDGHDIVAEGEVVKLYWPWQQVSVPDTNDKMLICTDFYKVVRNSEVNLTDARVEEINQLTIPLPQSIGFSGSLFKDMLPNQIKFQQLTAQFHGTRHRSSFDLAVVVLYAWRQCSPAIFLVKDVNDFLSFLEVPREYSEVMDVLVPGKSLVLEGIGVAEKVFITKNLAPFSVLYLFGAKQTYYFKLRWCKGMSSYQEEEEGLDIPMVEMGEDLTDFDEIFMAPPNQDHRISLKCHIKEKTDDFILVSDEELDNSLRIDFIFDPVIKMEAAVTACELNKTGILKFVRVIHGKTIWDHFTTWELPSEEDDESF